MSLKHDKLFEELIVPEVDKFMQEADFTGKATSLKKGETIKEEKRKELIEQLKMNDLRNHLEQAERLIREELPKLLPEIQYQQIIKELNEAPKNFIQFLKSSHQEEDKPLILKQLSKGEDKNLLQVYEMAIDCIQNKHYSDASSLLYYLITAEDHKDLKTTKKLRGKAKQQMQPKTEKVHPIEGKLMLFQHVFGFSDSTLLHIYELVLDCIHKKKYQEATSLLYYLVVLAPDIPGYWLGLGVCMQVLNEDQEALEVFEVVKNIQQHNPSPYIYSAEIFIRHDDPKRAKEELNHAQPFLNEAKPEDKKLYETLKQHLMHK